MVVVRGGRVGRQEFPPSSELDERGGLVYGFQVHLELFSRVYLPCSIPATPSCLVNV